MIPPHNIASQLYRRKAAVDVALCEPFNFGGGITQSIS